MTDTVAPLELIEQLVQERAKDLAIDMSSDDGADKLRALIAEAVQQWSLDHRRGLRPFDLADPAGVAERAFRNLASYGPLDPLLDDDDVWEIMINAPDGALREPLYREAAKHRAEMGRSGPLPQAR